MKRKWKGYERRKQQGIEHRLPFLLQLVSQLQTLDLDLSLLLVIQDALIGLSMDGRSIIVAKASRRSKITGLAAWRTVSRS